MTFNESLFRESAESAFYANWSLVQIREKRTPYRWAQDERWIGQGASPLSQAGDIKYDGGRMPWCQEPTESAVDPDVQVSVLWFASAMGKTDGVGSNIVGWGISESPANIMDCSPNENSRDKHVRDVIETGLIAATPCIRELLGEKKGREAGNAVSYKRFPGGSYYAIFAGSVSNFRGPRVRIARALEVDGMPGKVGVEGDPVFLLFKRCEGFAEAVKIVEGTATLRGKSRIEWWYGQSDQRKWFVPCRNCGTTQVLMWRHVHWPKGKHEKAVILCEHCATAHDDRQRVRMVMSGKWKPTAAFTGIRGYWINGLNSTLPPEKGFKNKLHQFAVDAHRAKHSQNPRETVKVWINTFLAETYQEEMMVKQEWRTLYDRRENFLETGKIPKGVVLITAGTDFQIDRCEVEFVGWGVGEETWGLGNVTIYGDFTKMNSPGRPWSYDQVEAVMTRQFQREDGATLNVCASGWDTGYAAAQRALYAFLRPRYGRRFYAMKGASGKAAPAIAKGRRDERVTLFIIGTNRVKTHIYNRATITAEGPGYMHFPKNDALGYNEEWFKQLLSEDAHSEYINGVQLSVFEMPASPGEDGSSRNEALDKRVYAQAALYIRGPVTWEIEEKRNLATIATAKTSEQQHRPQRKRGSWLNSWKDE